MKVKEERRSRSPARKKSRSPSRDRRDKDRDRDRDRGTRVKEEPGEERRGGGRVDRNMPDAKPRDRSPGPGGRVDRDMPDARRRDGSPGHPGGRGFGGGRNPGPPQGPPPRRAFEPPSLFSIHKGKVVRVAEFGAFVETEAMGSKWGLVHYSQVSTQFEFPFPGSLISTSTQPPKPAFRFPRRPAHFRRATYSPQLWTLVLGCGGSFPPVKVTCPPGHGPRDTWRPCVAVRGIPRSQETTRPPMTTVGP